MSSCKCECKSSSEAASLPSQGDNCCTFKINCDCDDNGKECVCTAMLTCGLDEGRCCRVECVCPKEGGCKCDVTCTESGGCDQKGKCVCRVEINCKRGGEHKCQCVCTVRCDDESGCKVECECPGEEQGCVCDCKRIDLAPGEKGRCKVQITCKCK